MTDIIFAVLAVLLLIVLLCILRRVSATIKLILIVGILLIAGALYIFLVPTSPVSMWITSDITGRVLLDADNKYETGDVVYEYTFSSESNNTMQDFAVGAVNSVLTNRVKALVEKYVELQENYTMPFKDAYLIITPEEDNVTVKIIKGEYLENK